MINVVGASQDQEKATPATIYNFTPGQKESVKPKTPTPTNPSSTFKSKFQPLASLFNQTPKLPKAAPLVISEITSKPDPLQSETAYPVTKPNQSKKALKLWLLVAAMIILIVGGGATFYLTQSNQDIRQQASENLPVTENLQPEIVIPTSQPTRDPTSEPTNLETGIASKSGGLADLVIQAPTLTSSTSSDLETDLLALNNSPTATPTAVPTIMPTTSLTPEPTGKLTDTTVNCNESCLADENCLNLTHSCYQGVCRLSSNLTSSSCLLVSGGSQTTIDEISANRNYTSYASPSGSVPMAGPANWLFYGLSGFGLLVFGALAILWL